MVIRELSAERRRETRVVGTMLATVGMPVVVLAAAGTMAGVLRDPIAPRRLRCAAVTALFIVVFVAYLAAAGAGRWIPLLIGVRTICAVIDVGARGSLASADWIVLANLLAAPVGVSVLSVQIRTDDYVTRIDGAEFVVAFKEYSQRQAIAVVERTRLLLQSDERTNNIDFSYGCFEYVPKSGLSADELLRITDSRMYDFKRLKSGNTE